MAKTASIALPPLAKISPPIFDACGCEVETIKLFFSTAKVFFANVKKNKKSIFNIDLNKFFIKP